MLGKSSVEVRQGPQGANISFNGRLLYSASSTPEKRLRSLPEASEALYVLISPLLFHGTNKLISMLPVGSDIIAVEHDPEIYRQTSDYHQSSALKEQDYILVDSSSADMLAEYIIKLRCRKIITVKLNLGYMINRRFYDELIQNTESFLSNFWKNRMTTIHMGRLWCRNIILNTPRISNASFISNLKTDKPVISLGAGESLEENIPFIKKNRERFFLTAADTAVTSLLLNGIRPDLVIALESQHANLYDFYEDDSFDLPVAADLTSSPELLRKLRGPLYFYISEFDYSIIFKLLDNSGLLPPLLPPLGSVGITSLLISLLLTDNWVLFSGLDFSFIPDKYHAQGAPSHIISQLNESRLQKTGFFHSAYSVKRTKETDKSGRIVYTDLVMKSYAETLSRLITDSGRTIDLGKYGLENPAPAYSEDQLFEILCSKPADGSELLNRNREMIKKPFCSPSDFLKTEAGKLERAISEVVEFQNYRDEKSVLPEETLILINELDYTWLFFPDKNPLPSSDSSFLRRFLFSASWFSSQISHASALINPQS